MIHQCGDSLTAGRLRWWGRPNLLLDPTHLYPHYKSTTSLPDMLLSRGFLWRCLKAAVPTMTLSRRSEAPQCRGPVGYFSMDEAGRRGRGVVVGGRSGANSHSYILSHLHTTTLFTPAAVRATHGGG